MFAYFGGEFVRLHDMYSISKINELQIHGNIFSLCRRTNPATVEAFNKLCESLHGKMKDNVFKAYVKLPLASEPTFIRRNYENWIDTVNGIGTLHLENEDIRREAIAQSDGTVELTLKSLPKNKQIIEEYIERFPYDEVYMVDDAKELIRYKVIFKNSSYTRDGIDYFTDEFKAIMRYTYA